jgi:molecular chaperone GrpE
MAEERDDETAGGASEAAADPPPTRESPSEDELLEAAAVAEEDPAEVHGMDEERFVDGTVGRSDLAAERDEYREALQRLKAEFENYRKRVDRDRQAERERAAEGLVGQLLPILDACEAATGHGEAGVEPIHKQLLDLLEREGLELLLPIGEAFDPNAHEAVLHEEGDGGDPVVVEALRTGYAWHGRVLRPAMVKVRG